MNHTDVGPLYEVLREKVIEWRARDYEVEFAAISEILNYNYDKETGNLRFLRKAQFEALETYWYLRLIENTPHIFDLYRKLYSNSVNLLKALNISTSQEDLIQTLSSGGINSIFERIKADDDFVRKYRLETIKETLTLDYPSYIFALAMGAGKTILIGAIIATEFAMALEYPDKDIFVKNALVFAPGKTILGALKELSDIPFEKILPNRLYKYFINNVKFTYTRDGEKDIPILKGSYFNIVVTNTEKIRIQKQAITRSLLNFEYDLRKEDEIKQEIANRRLQTIASLPNLAIFSDEAHHTYGMRLGEELKRVRQTVNYLAKNTRLIVVVNTTGTPYFGREILKDVVYWYGLTQGIKDGILKEVRGNIVSYEEVTDEYFINDVINDFFKNYKNVKIHDGSSAKLAIYFPRIEDLRNAKPLVEKALINIGLDPTIVLEVHNESPKDIQELFDNRINDPYLPYRVFLLVNKGTEGWNCPSLFATALARELRASNNFCLQAATRCLRQVPGNTHKAKIYLSKQNVKILDAQLKETYGETLRDLNRTKQNLIKEKVVVRKSEIPPVLFKRKVREVRTINKNINLRDIEIKKPELEEKEGKKIFYDIREIPDRKGVLITKDMEKIILEDDFVDLYTFSVELSSLYRLPLLEIYEKLKELYPDGEIPMIHSFEIKKQIEEKVRNYEIVEKEVEVALALIKLEGFDKEEKDNKPIYTTEIVYHKDKEHLLVRYENYQESTAAENFSFHLTPYKFDSEPEKDFFENILNILEEDPDDVEGFYFIGGVNDPKKSDFVLEYRGKDGKMHNYTPDFLIKKKDGKVIIVEIKGKPFRNEEEEMLIKDLEAINPEKLKYEILLIDKDKLSFEQVNRIRELIYKQGV
ncbi:MAG: DEAD/DEAH box helicase family protein [candidate division WOR-3 bacterium]